jgi:hypothetical protein
MTLPPQVAVTGHPDLVSSWLDIPGLFLSILARRQTIRGVRLTYGPTRETCWRRRVLLTRHNWVEHFTNPGRPPRPNFSGAVVTDIFLVSDNGPGSGGLGSQTVLIDNTNVNGTVYDYEFTSKDDCKDGGWKNFTSAPGPFKNQGDCVSYFAHQK